jgi:hypothetical protein
LGIRRQNAEQFIVADAVLGIFAVNFEKGGFIYLTQSNYSYSIIP